MIEFQQLIQHNRQFKELCNSELNCNSFLFESQDSIFLNNFAYSFAKYLMCEGSEVKPCNLCSQCKKVELLSHADVILYPKNKKNILVDDVKNLIEDVSLTPVESDKKIYIFNNFSSANTQSQNKLLKILEEPPKNVYIFLCVTNINKVLPTILSRCKKIRLEALTDCEIKTCLPTESGLTEEQASLILDFSQGSIEKALNFCSSQEFLQVYKNCLLTLLEMKDSKTLLAYSTKFSKDKQTFETALDVFELVFRDILMLRLGQESLVKNKTILDKLAILANDFDCDALDKIIKKIYFIKKQLSFNCNYVLLIDNLLLYILEVKFLCKK